MQDEAAVAQAHERSVDNLRQSLPQACKALSSAQLLETADSLRSKVVLVTGAGSGIGAAYSAFAATLGAKVVLADLNEKGLERTYNEIEVDSGLPGRVFKAPLTSVTQWADLQNLFEWTIAEFGQIDIVVSCAGVTEFSEPGFAVDVLDENGKLLPPNLSTLDINLKGSLYTTKIATYYMTKQKTGGSIILLASLSSFFGIPMGPMYTTSKHGILGFVRSSHYTSYPQGVSITAVAPWFTDTPILNVPIKLMLAGLPFTKMQDVVQAIVYLSTHREASGATLAVDPKGVLLLEHESSLYDDTTGFYVVFAQRAVFMLRMLLTVRDAIQVIAGAIGGGFLLFFFGAVTAFAGWRYLN